MSAKLVETKGTKINAESEMESLFVRDSLRTADAFPVVASLPPKNSVCVPERQNDFRDVKAF